MNIECFKDYILLHNGDFYCDASDSVFDAIVTVDCCVVRDEQDHSYIDIGAGDDYPNMDRFFNAFAEKVRIVQVNGDTPIIDINGWLDYNREKVMSWIKEHWQDGESWTDDEWDDVKYQFIQEINSGIAGYKGNKTYGLYADLFESMPMAEEAQYGNQ